MNGKHKKTGAGGEGALKEKKTGKGPRTCTFCGRYLRTCASNPVYCGRARERTRMFGDGRTWEGFCANGKRGTHLRRLVAVATAHAADGGSAQGKRATRGGRPSAEHVESVFGQRGGGMGCSFWPLGFCKFLHAGIR